MSARSARPSRGLVAGLAGLALGWAAAAYLRAVLAREAEEEERELAETAIVITPGRTG